MIGQFTVQEDGSVLMVLPAALLELAGYVDDVADEVPTPANRPPAVHAADDVLLTDPLSQLELEQAACEITEALTAAASRQDALAHALLSATAHDGQVVGVLEPDDLVDLAGWVNRLALRVRGTDVTVGQGQDAFGDAELDALLGQDDPTSPMEVSPREVVTALLSAWAISLLKAHHQATALSR